MSPGKLSPVRSRRRGTGPAATDPSCGGVEATVNRLEPQQGRGTVAGARPCASAAEWMRGLRVHGHVEAWRASARRDLVEFRRCLLVDVKLHLYTWRNHYLDMAISS